MHLSLLADSRLLVAGSMNPWLETRFPRMPSPRHAPQVEAHKLGLPSAERSAGTDKLLSAAKKALKGVAASVIAPEVAAATGAGAPAGGAVVPPKKKHKRRVCVLCVC
jgi:hypothetical protein